MVAMRRSNWDSDIKALARLYAQGGQVKAWIDGIKEKPKRYWSWGNRAFPVAVSQEARDLSDLLVFRDPLVIKGQHGFRKVSFTYWPAPFVLDYVDEIMDASKRVQIPPKDEVKRPK